jgi:glycosyltransferase involved in cell wall biosynthesis
MCELGIPKKLIRKGYDAVDNDYFSSNSLRARGEDAQLRAQHGLPERYILCVSRLVPRKNIRTLLKAYAESREEGVQLVVIGYGPEKQSLDQFAASLNISSSVKFIESVANSAMPLYYALAETFVLLSLQDQWGLAVNEALACGLPVIVSERCGCVDEIVRDGDNGFIVDPTNVPQIANRLNRIIKDSGLRASMGANSREVISEYGLPLFASNFIDLCLAIQDTPLTAVKQ